MLLSEEDFHHCRRLLLRSSSLLGDGWSWESVQEEGFLRKTIIRDACWTQGSDGPGSDLESRGWDLHQLEGDVAEPSIFLDDVDEDSGNEEVSSDTTRLMLQVEYHILFSCSYGAPVLFFRAFTLGGRSLSLEEVWRSVHPAFRLRLHSSPLDTISQQEHPLLGQPFFMVHPCRTAEFLRPVLQEAQQEHRPVNLLLTWLSVVGPLVGLDVPLQYWLLQLESADAKEPTDLPPAGGLMEAGPNHVVPDPGV